MIGEALQGLATQWPGILLGAFSATALGRATQLWSSRRAHQERAAEGLLHPLGMLELLVRSWRYRQVPADDVARTMVAWDEAWRRHGGLLPRAWGALGRDVRLAVGNSLGGAAACSAESPLPNEWRPDAYEYHWWDISITYLDHVCAAIHAFQLASNRQRKGLRPSPYHEWRRCEDDQYFGRSERTPPRELRPGDA